MSSAIDFSWPAHFIWILEETICFVDSSTFRVSKEQFIKLANGILHDLFIMMTLIIREYNAGQVVCK